MAAYFLGESGKNAWACLCYCMHVQYSEVAMGKTLIRYTWSYMDPIRKRRVQTRYKATEDQIRVEHPDAVPVEGSREELVISDDPLSCCTSGFLRCVANSGGLVSTPDEKKPPTKGG